MKKILFSLIILVFFLSGCESKEKEVFTYGLSKSTFESYYDTYYQVQDGEHDEVVFRVSPKHTYETSNAIVNVSVYVQYVFNYDIVKEVMSGIIDLTKTTELRKPLLVGSNHQILGYTIDQAVGFVNTEVVITEESHTYTKPFELNESIPISDKQLSLSNLQSLMSMLSDYKLTLEDGFELMHTIDMTVSMGEYVETTSESAKETYVKTPLYYHLETEDSELFMKDGVLYSYEGQFYLGKKLLDMYSISESEALSNTLHMTQALDFESTLKNIFLYEKNGDVFKVTAKIRDILDIETYLGLVALYNSLGLDSSMIEQSRIFLVFDFSSDLRIETTYSLVYPEQDLVITSSVNQIFYTDFEVVDPTEDTNYVLSYPNEMDEVFALTDFAQTTTQSAPGNVHYYKGHLDAGVYEFNLSMDYYEYALYDEVGNRLIFTYPEIDNLAPYITIETPGYYYIKIDRSSAPVKNNYSFFLYKTTLSDYLTTINISTNQTYDLNLEGETDFIHLKFPYTGYKIIEFTFDTDAPFTLYYKDITGYKAVTVTDTFRHLLKTDTNDFYIKGDASGTFTYTLSDINHALYEGYYDVMTPLRTSFFPTDFFYGNDPGFVYLRFEVLTAGHYQFFVKGDAGASIFRQEGYSAYYEGMVFNNNIRYFEPGLYYVEFRNDELMSSNIYHLPVK